MRRAGRLLLILECVLFLTPATVLLVIAGAVAGMALLAFDLDQGEELRARLRLLCLFGLPFLLGGAAVIEVWRVAVATMRGRALPFGRRSAISALAGVVGAAGWIAGGLLDPDGRAPSSDSVLTAIGVVGLVVALALQLLWQQRRLAQAEAWRSGSGDA